MKRRRTVGVDRLDRIPPNTKSKRERREVLVVTSETEMTKVYEIREVIEK